jgi:type 2 lantibiotic biosynthesis protein LanM
VNQTDFQDSGWYQAITLTERIASLSAVRNQIPNVEVNADFAQRRMQRWRSQPPFTIDSYFAQRLAMDGITEDEFLSLVSEPIESVKQRFPDTPTWLVQLTQAFSNPAASNPEMLPPPEAMQGQEADLFLYVIEPLISQGCNRLDEGIQALIQGRSDLPFEPNAVAEMLLANLPEQLLRMLNRTLVLELHVARLQGLLKGDTPEERFRSFLARLRQHDVALSILQEYPVLARQITICINHCVTFSLEFLQHLCADWDELRTTFSPEADPGLLVELHGGAGDSHRGGRSVLIAKFSSGFQLVYKPRALAVDVHFQELLTWINEHGDHPPFRTLKVLDRGNYGWVEFVAAFGCTTAEEIQRFYERQGGYLALLYALEATDFHYENLIAAGEHPVLIDLESLFHPRIGGVNITKSDQVANQRMAYSVLSVGLLPMRLWSNAEYEGIDVSGLGKTEGQLTPNRVPYWEAAGTDEMRLNRERMKMAGTQNRPTLEGTEVNLLDYTEAITTGFTNIYELLLKHRDELLSKDGPLARFAEDEVRVVLRATRTYASLLQESFHPDVLRNALDRDRLFDHLWVDVKYCPYLVKVIPSEREDLHGGDIPMFTTRPNSRDLWSSSNERIADFLDEPSMTLVHHRLQRLSDHDLEQQVWFVRASLATLYMGVEQAGWSTYPVTEPQTITDREQLLAAACAIGDRLKWLALQDEDNAHWIGLRVIDERHWSLAPLWIDLYEGLPGVVLFLAYLGAIAQQERYTALARAALTTMRRQLEDNKSFITSVGAFNGWGGVIYTLAHLGVMWAEPRLLAEAEEIVELLPALIEKDEQLDIINGAAGCLGSLISLYRCQPTQRTLAAAILCGDHLIAHAQSMEHGIGWVLKGTQTKALSGFSHGAAGIAWALLELSALTGEDRFRTAALDALTYERSLFCPELENWLDLRVDESSGHAVNDHQHTCMTAWCNGAPGIGLGRLRSLPDLDDSEIRAEIDTALKTTLAQGFGLNHSLCHGDLGNLELLLQASLILDDPQWETQVNRLASIILESINQHGWLCGVPLGVETPGLMAGLAGIGYGLLRLAEPTRVPSVLVLEPPLNIPVVKAVAEASAR